ncbi:MAG: ASPIC/UnbV domain-containing protein [Planctomycetota bacterium]|nr:ASPIC/UnbV domain-containing protein [Planctomycetota bacterium]MDA1114589.1 ASPIC/UnbV domain-containing protein [Planctomycetota bacterium]
MDRDDTIRESRSEGRSAEAVVEPGGVGRGASWSGHERNHLWINQAGQDFLELSGVSGADEPWDSRTFSLLDYDHDGFQDFVMVNANAPFVQVFRNQFGDLLPEEKRGGAIHLRLTGGNQTAQPSSEWSNRDGIGARIQVQAGEQSLLREYRCGEGLGAQNSATLSVGVGLFKGPILVTVLWPSGKVTGPTTVSVGDLVFANETESQLVVGKLEAKASLAPAISSKDVALQPTSPELARLLKGKTSASANLITTWFTTCAACKRAEPTYQAIRKAFTAEELGLFGFNNDAGDSKKEMQQYAERFQPAYTLLLDRTEDDIDAIKALQDSLLPPVRPTGSPKEEAVSNLTPSCLLVDAQGRILYAWAGVPTVSELKLQLSNDR